MVFLDSNHTHEHVLEELELYAPYVSKGSYCVVWDTGVEDLPDECVPTGPGAKATIRKPPSGNICDGLKEGRKARDGPSCASTTITRSSTRS